MPLTFVPNQLGANYPVNLSVFQGPLDLLLQLIERNELEISTVSLMAVTDSYLKTVEMLEEIDPGALADFLLVASRLIYIKSRSLLPQPRPAGEEDDEEDSADALLKQLLEYRRFKQVAESLRQRERAGLRAYVRPASAPEVERRFDLSNATVERLQAVLRKVLQRIPSHGPMPRVKTYPITIAEQIETVRRLVQTARQHQSGVANGAATLRFTDLLGESISRIEVVVTFLAILELIKQQELQVSQEETFGEIVLVVAYAPSLVDN
jgi:segregation and condensation protein A